MLDRSSMIELDPRSFGFQNLEMDRTEQGGEKYISKRRKIEGERKVLSDESCHKQKNHNHLVPKHKSENP